jgi:hypothetical protein
MIHRVKLIEGETLCLIPIEPQHYPYKDCPYSIGDELWGIEEWCAACNDGGICYKNDVNKLSAINYDCADWQPASTMPSEFSRWRRVITGIRVIYVPEINMKDTYSTGFRWAHHNPTMDSIKKEAQEVLSSKWVDFVHEDLVITHNYEAVTWEKVEEKKAHKLILADIVADPKRMAEEHRKMWLWLADNTGKGKEAYFGTIDIDRTPLKGCFYCHVYNKANLADYTCTGCPLKNHEPYIDFEEACCHGYYVKWMGTHAPEYARKIAYMV